MTEQEQVREEIGLLRDKCENLLCAALLPMPPEIHVDGMTHGIQGIQIKLTEIYKRLAAKP